MTKQEYINEWLAGNVNLDELTDDERDEWYMEAEEEWNAYVENGPTLPVDQWECVKNARQAERV